MKSVFSKGWRYVLLGLAIIIFIVIRNVLPELYGFAGGLLGGSIALFVFTYIDDYLNGKLDTYEQIENGNLAYAIYFFAIAFVFAVGFATPFIAFITFK